MKMIDASELEDFYSSIQSLGFNLNDFELIEIGIPASKSDVFALTGDVEIWRKSRDLRKIYGTGHGSSWPAQFHQDLQAGVFDCA
jgi:hypothetical protein